MSVIQSVLEEEAERMQKKITFYESMLLNLPRGSIFIRKMGNQSFAYRKRKVKGKVVSQYLGNVNNEAVQNEIKLSEEYQRIKANIKYIKEELHKLKKALVSIEDKQPLYRPKRVFYFS